MRAAEMAIGETGHMDNWLSWVPGVISGGVVGAVGAFLVGWRNVAVMAAVMEERFRGIREAAEKDERNREKDGRAAARTEETLTREIRDALLGMQALATDVKVIATEQGAVNKITAKTLEGIMTKLERHDEILASHSTAIALIAAGRGGEVKI